MRGEPPDTIYARASAAGVAPIAVIRITGARAHACVSALLRGNPPAARRLSLRRLVEPASGEMLDEAMVVLFDPPATATGEAMAELHVHGGRAVVAAVSAALEVAGARPAGPGDFSRRALLNGRADLTRLEAVAALIDAETATQRRAATRNLTGALFDRVAEWRSQVVALRMEVDAALDFSDQDLPDVEIMALEARMKALALDLRTVLAGAKRTALLSQGVEVALVGAPNTGKSSLLNRLAGREMALTSAVAGTTRDVIEARCAVGGRLVTFLDTAGLRATEDRIEQAGVDWGVRRASAAGLVIGVCAPDAPAFHGKADILVWNKADLAPPPPAFAGTALSALTGAGVDRLVEAVAARLDDAPDDVGAVINERQARGLALAADALEASVDVELDIVAEHLRAAADALESIVGRIDVEDVLDSIFAGFCIGK